MVEAIILAGGKGTRIQPVIGAYPKPMAKVGGHPFMAYLLRHLETQGITDLRLSLGFGHKIIEDWMQTQSFSFDWQPVIESTPMGTGGAIRLSMETLKGDTVLVLNGDSLFPLDLGPFLGFHQEKKAECSLALKEMIAFDRYGRVEVDDQDRILAFEEKQPCSRGWINTGVYLVHRPSFLEATPSAPFSFEKDYLEAFYREHPFYGYRTEAYFIDIGIPEDYARAQSEMKTLFPL